jgi:hypothetical protein
MKNDMDILDNTEEDLFEICFTEDKEIIDEKLHRMKSHLIFETDIWNEFMSFEDDWKNSISFMDHSVLIPDVFGMNPGMYWSAMMYNCRYLGMTHEDILEEIKIDESAMDTHGWSYGDFHPHLLPLTSVEDKFPFERRMAILSRLLKNDEGFLQELHEEAEEARGPESGCFVDAIFSKFFGCSGDQNPFSYRNPQIGNSTLLHLAVSCLSNLKCVVKYLISRGCDVNAEDEDGWTPLLLAVEAKDTDAVDLLLKRGANISHETPTGLSVIQIGTENNFISYLIEIGVVVHEGESLKINENWNSNNLQV